MEWDNHGVLVVEISSNSFDGSAILLDNDDSAGLADDGDNPFDLSLLCGNPAPILSQGPHQLVEESCFERIPFPALLLDNSNESLSDTRPEQLFQKSSSV